LAVLKRLATFASKVGPSDDTAILMISAISYPLFFILDIPVLFFCYQSCAIQLQKGA
jgi:hypothetical protein